MDEAVGLMLGSSAGLPGSQLHSLSALLSAAGVRGLRQPEKPGQCADGGQVGCCIEHDVFYRDELQLTDCHGIDHDQQRRQCQHEREAPPPRQHHSRRRGDDEVPAQHRVHPRERVARRRNRQQPRRSKDTGDGDIDAEKCREQAGEQPIGFAQQISPRPPTAAQIDRARCHTGYHHRQHHDRRQEQGGCNRIHTVGQVDRRARQDANLQDAKASEQCHQTAHMRLVLTWRTNWLSGPAEAVSHSSSPARPQPLGGRGRRECPPGAQRRGTCLGCVPRRC